MSTAAKPKAVNGMSKPKSSRDAPRDKSRDPPFALVYVGFLVAVVALRGHELFEYLPTREELMEVPDRPSTQQVALVASAYAAGVPLMMAVRSAIKRALVAPLAESFAGLEPGSPKHGKFLEQGWLFVYYSFIVALNVAALRDKPWWPPVLDHEATLQLAAPREDRVRDQEDPLVAAVYFVGLSFYATELVSLLRLPRSERRSDFVVYLIHHVYTNLLLAGSWLSWNHRIGSLVLFLHDLADVALPIAKCLSYSEDHLRRTKPRAVYEAIRVVGTGCFVAFIVLFIVPRNIMFGMLTWHGMTTVRWFNWCYSNGQWVRCTAGGGHLPPVVLLTTLGLLYPLHVFWAVLIIKMAAKVLFAAQYDDVRSDDE